MQQVLMIAASALLFASAHANDSCEAEKDDVHKRICLLERSVHTVESALQEMLQRVDMTVQSDDLFVPEKRKNEFIRFGKRSFDEFGEGQMEKRKNEFIRFGKRKNEFIRFGRSDPELLEGEVTKRKNEFIRFG